MKEEELIKRGFNHGYELQKRDPDLAGQIASGFRDYEKPYAKGFISGSIECIKELGLNVSDILNKSVEKGKSPEMER